MPEPMRIYRPGRLRSKSTAGTKAFLSAVRAAESLGYIVTPDSVHARATVSISINGRTYQAIPSHDGKMRLTLSIPVAKDPQFPEDSDQEALELLELQNLVPGAYWSCLSPRLIATVYTLLPAEAEVAADTMQSLFETIRGFAGHHKLPALLERLHAVNLGYEAKD